MCWDSCKYAIGQSFGQIGQRSFLAAQSLLGQFSGFGKTNHSGHIDGSGPQVSLVSASMYKAAYADTLFGVQAADPFGTVQLVSGGRKQIDP